MGLHPRALPTRRNPLGVGRPCFMSRATPFEREEQGTAVAFHLPPGLRVKVRNILIEREERGTAVAFHLSSGLRVKVRNILIEWVRGERGLNTRVSFSYALFMLQRVCHSPCVLVCRISDAIHNTPGTGGYVLNLMTLVRAQVPQHCGLWLVLTVTWAPDRHLESLHRYLRSSFCNT